jgi:hypothetical protein
MNHFTRLIELTSADEEYVASLATSIAPCVLRPRTESSLTMEEKHAYRLLRDLFANKDAIFSELKRMSTNNLGHSSSVGAASQRPRAISTDESNRKAAIEERNRALLDKAAGSRSRATSPAPGPRSGTGAPGHGHRRDRSIGGPETRFPIASPTVPTHDRAARASIIGAAKRQSLEVPDGSEASAPGGGGGANGASTDSPTQALQHEALLEKRNSLGRSTARFSGGGRRLPLMAGTAAAHAGETPGERGVQLVDRPMDD